MSKNTKLKIEFPDTSPKEQLQMAEDWLGIKEFLANECYDLDKYKAGKYDRKIFNWVKKEVVKEIKRIDEKWVGKIEPFIRKKKCSCSWNENGRFGVCLECVKERIYHHNGGKKFIVDKILNSLNKGK